MNFSIIDRQWLRHPVKATSLFQVAMAKFFFFVLFCPTLVFAESPQEAGWEGAKIGLAQAFLVTIGCVVWYVGREIYRRIKSNRTDAAKPKSAPFSTAMESRSAGFRAATASMEIAPSHTTPIVHPKAAAAIPNTGRDEYLEVAANAIYEAIATEIESNNTDRGLWTRLYAECDGDEKKTKVQYIKARAAQLIAAEKAKQTAQAIAAKEAAAIGLQAQQASEHLEVEAKKRADELLKVNQTREAEEDAFKCFGIEKRDRKYHFQGYSYDALKDAVAYARRIHSRNR